MAYEKIVSVPSTATSGQVPQADGAGGVSWGAVDAYTKAQTLTEATKIAYGLGADAVPDDVFNAVKGLLGGGAKIATGSYIGTGTYGASNPCSLTFDFTPQIVIILGHYDGNGGCFNGFGVLVNGNVRGLMMQSPQNMGSPNTHSHVACACEWRDKQVSFYGNDAEGQFNLSNPATTYYYVAIG